MKTLPPHKQTPAPVAIVFEKRPRWAPELERQFLNEEVQVIACRSLQDVSQRCAGLSLGVVLLDFVAEAAGCLQFLLRHASNSSPLPVFIIASDAWTNLEWSLRDLGAAAFFAKKIPGHAMANLCRRQWSPPYDKP